VLVSVAKVLTTQNLAQLQDRLIFIKWDANAGPPALVATQIAASGFTIPVLQLTVRDYEGVFEVLTTLPRKFPAQMLRKLKQHVYELVMSKKPDTKLHVVDIEDIRNAQQLDVVFGVGVQERLSGRRDLLLDVLAETSAYDAARVVDEALPAVMRQPAHIPVFRYLREAGRLRDDGTLAPKVSLDPKLTTSVKTIRDHIKPHDQLRRKARRLAAESGGKFKTLAANHSV
jgi:hypothetical protein